MNKNLRFSLAEVCFLQHIITQNSAIVHNKKIDSASLAAKKQAWAQMTDQFNCVPTHNKRTIGQLQKCFHNLKTKKKRNLEQLQRRQMLAIRGPYMPLQAVPTSNGSRAEDNVSPPAPSAISSFNIKQEPDYHPVLTNHCIQYDVKGFSADDSQLEHSMSCSEFETPQCEDMTQDFDEVDHGEEEEQIMVTPLISSQGSPEQDSPRTEKVYGNNTTMQAAAVASLGRGRALTKYDKDLSRLRLKEASLRMEIAEEELRSLRMRNEVEETSLKKRHKMQEQVMEEELKRSRLQTEAVQVKLKQQMEEWKWRRTRLERDILE